MTLKVTALVLCSSLALPAFHASAQWTVVDPTQIMENLINHGESIAKHLEQIDRLKDQLKQAEEQYKSLTGVRGFGDLFNNPALRDYLPEEWTNLYDAVQRGDIAGISGRVDELIAAAQEGSIEEMAHDIEERQARLGAVNHAVGEAGFEAALQRTEQIQHLIEEISNTQDPKGIAELQARIAGEQAAVSNEMAKLQLVAMLQQAEERMIEARIDAMSKKHLTGSNAVPPPPPIEDLLRMPTKS